MTPESHVIYCKGCRHAWTETIVRPLAEEDHSVSACSCICADDTYPHYEDWVVDPDPAETRRSMRLMDIGQVAYEGYVASCGGKSIRGEKLPDWEHQTPELREHWRASADAVTMFLDLLGNNPDSTGDEFSPPAGR